MGAAQVAAKAVQEAAAKQAAKAAGKQAAKKAMKEANAANAERLEATESADQRAGHRREQRAKGENAKLRVKESEEAAERKGSTGGANSQAEDSSESNSNDIFD